MVIIQGMYKVPFPILATFVLCSAIHMEEWRCNSVCIFVLTTPIEARFFCVTESQFEDDFVAGYAAATLDAVVAPPIGLYIASHVSASPTFGSSSV